MIYTPLSGTVEPLYRWIQNLEVRNTSLLKERQESEILNFSLLLFHFFKKTKK